ncbi:MAG: cyclase family protein [Candidatus Nezhaarchaeota archaeon]|nr:cyclase family protein [Candidatus Nezhaarchaeota archaeon]MCX8141366.1 cyclase family protein [Candidatus Nezhaarchaeota archaeon]MDW8049632.1 cyclase family protein [Nitrososphaerota archaeon]
MGKVRIIDLSLPLEHNSPLDPEPYRPRIRYVDHREGAVDMLMFFGIKPSDLVYSGGLGWSIEEITAITHTGTHLDAPWHYHPISEGRLAKTVDEIPLEWCFSDGVILDFRHKKPGDYITVDDLKGALRKINYTIKPYDIVLIMTGRDRYAGTPEYFEQPGLSHESILWLVDQGVKIIGIDAYTLDRPFKYMAEEYKRVGDGRVIWPAHFAGIKREYCHIEKLANLDKVPVPHGFKVACFPVKITKASAAWCRAVAIIEES